MKKDAFGVFAWPMKRKSSQTWFFQTPLLKSRSSVCYDLERFRNLISAKLDRLIIHLRLRKSMVRNIRSITFHFSWLFDHFYFYLVALNALPNFIADPNEPKERPAPHHRCTIHLNCEESQMLDKAYQQGSQGLIPDRYNRSIKL